MAHKITRSSGNVFADVGLPDAPEHELKARVVITLHRAIESQRLTQAEAAKRIGIHQPDLSDILRGKFRGFSLERLLNAVTKLGSDVEIKIKKPRNAHNAKHEGHLCVVTA